MTLATANPAASEPKLAPLKVKNIRLIADDLTGACDAAASFVAGGHSVRAWLGPAATHSATESVQAFNTASRTLSPEAAAATVREAATPLSTSPNTLLFKKIDSAARGPLVAELLSAHHALATQAILFALSFPAASRTVSEGTLHTRDASGLQTDILLAALFPSADIALITKIAAPGNIEPALASGKTILLCDAATQSDLEALARAAASLPIRFLYAGSAGLAKALATIHTYRSPDSTIRPLSAKSILTITGTPHPVTLLQLDHLITTLPQAPLLRIQAETSDAPTILARFQHHNPDALLLTGGDTALLTLQTLGAHSILLHGELAPGIPWGKVQGGLAHDRIVITKSGGFGSSETLTQIIQSLTKEPSARTGPAAQIEPSA